MFIRSYEEEYVAKYTLPELSYDYGALEPHISGRIMELHHTKHHNTYVNGANTALEKLEAAREDGDFSTITQLTKDLAFNLGGHTNHSIFWNNLSPDGGDKPTGELATIWGQVVPENGVEQPVPRWWPVHRLVCRHHMGTGCTRGHMRDDGRRAGSH